MKVIPVIDILNGVAVHAVKGERENYQPLKSVLVNSSDPIAIALALQALGFKELYIADLNAITGKGKNLPLIEQVIQKTGLNIMIDCGVTDIAMVRELARLKVKQVIMGMETLPSLDTLRQAIREFGSERLVVSLDLKEGKVLSKSKYARSLNPLELASELDKLGVSEIIVLDLARVGSNKGVDFALLEQLLSFVSTRVLVGGGVRDIDDLLALEKMGIHGVLLATALHNGKTTAYDLKRTGFIKTS